MVSVMCCMFMSELPFVFECAVVVRFPGQHVTPAWGAGATPGAGAVLRPAGPFFGEPRIEFLLVDDHAFMCAFSNAVDAVMRNDREKEPPAVDAVERHVDGDGQPRRRCREMREVDQGAQRLFARPVEVRADGLDAGPFHQPDHEAGGEHLRHLLERFGLRVEVGHGLVRRHGVAELVGQAGLQRGFHGVVVCRLWLFA
jgi:hypothetical protein